MLDPIIIFWISSDKGKIRLTNLITTLWLRFHCLSDKKIQKWALNYSQNISCSNDIKTTYHYFLYHPYNSNKWYHSSKPHSPEWIRSISWEILSSMMTLHKKWSFPLRNSSVNVTKSAGICGFGQIYWRNP